MLVPRMAPRITEIACRTFIMPEFTKPTTMTEVADEDWITAVTPVPSRIPFKGVPDRRNRIGSSLFPETRLRPSPMRDMPKRNMATPPSRLMTSEIPIVSLPSPSLYCPHVKSAIQFMLNVC